MLLNLDQTPAKYFHLSCIFSPCHGASGLSNSLISSKIQVHPHKTILILCDKHISVNFSCYCCLIWQATDKRMANKRDWKGSTMFNIFVFVSDMLLECYPLAIKLQHYVVMETTQIYKTMISLDSYISTYIRETIQKQ